MTFQQKLEAQIAKAQAEQEILYAESLERLLDNPAFIETQRQIAAKATELRRLSATIAQLNAIQPFVANDGTKYGVTVYPTNFFGHGLGEILGIVASSRSAFTDDLMLQYSAITGINPVELAEAEAALGRPAYCQKDGTVVEAVPGNLAKLKEILRSICIKLDIKTINLDELTQDKYDLWFTRSELAANKKAADFHRNLTLDAVRFTMEG